MPTSTTQESRLFRVFVSSTFGDMKAERDELVKYVFPELRKLCEKRAVAWGVVDLRWGITDAQQQQGEVLPICLHDIERCNVFISLLGERYGTLPSSIPDELEARQPWLREHREHSVTSLEIMHGVLRKSPQDVHAFFYFRDPHYINSLSVDKRAAYCESSPERQAKLAALKKQIRQRGFQPYENYADPTALGKRVLDDLVKLLDELYPETSVPDPLAREASDHEAFAESRRRVYIGGDKYYERLDQHADGDGPPLVILGESGSGKSALLANWAARYCEHHPDVLIILHFIGSSVYSTDWEAMLRRIMGEFKRRFGITQDIPDKPDELRLAFANFLNMAAARGRVILLLDGLNQLEDRDQAPDLVWLPPMIPGNVRLIVSSLPGRSLDDLTNRQWPTLQVEPLTPDERAALIQRYLYDVQSRRLADEQVQEIVAAPVTSNPLYLKVLLEELGTHGEHATLGARIRHYLAATSVHELFSKVLARYEGDYERERPGLVKDVMTRLWAARRGLSESELLDMLGQDGRPLPRAIWSPLYLAAEHALITRSGLIGFFHDFLRRAVEQRYLPTEQDQHSIHLLIADYFSTRELSPRKVDELPWQLAEAKEWQRLYSLLADLAFFETAWKTNQWDVMTQWASIERMTTLKMTEAYGRILPEPGRFTDSCWRIAHLYKDFGHFEEAWSLLTLLAEHCVKMGDKDGLAACVNSQATLLRVTGDLDGAMVLYKNSKRLSKKSGNKGNVASSLGNQAAVLRAQGDLRAALARLKEAEQIYRKLGDKKNLAGVLGIQGLVLHDRGDLDKAMTRLKEAERLSRELGDKAGLQSCIGNQALVHETRGDLESAMHTLKQQERLCTELGMKDNLQTCLGNQAVIFLHRGDLDGAMTLLNEKERLCRELGNKDGLQRCLGNKAVICLHRGDLDGAMALMKEQERLCQELGNKDGLQISFGNQANILITRGDLDGAMMLLKKKELLSRETGNPKGLAESLANQGVILAQENRGGEALKIVEEAHELATRHGLNAIARQIKDILDLVRSQTK